MRGWLRTRCKTGLRGVVNRVGWVSSLFTGEQMDAKMIRHAVLDQIALHVGLIERVSTHAPPMTVDERVEEIVEYIDDLVNENSLLVRKFRASVLATRAYGRHQLNCSIFSGFNREVTVENEGRCDCGWMTVKDAFPEVKA